MQEIDYLIVGSGIGGLCVAECLNAETKSFLIIDKQLPGAASIVSSGLINPVTGKRFVKSWNFNEIEASFRTFYKDLEKRLQLEFFSEIQLVETLHSAEDENQWLSRTNDPDYIEYMGSLDTNKIEGYKKTGSGVYGKIKKAYRIDVEKLLPRWIEIFKQEDKLIHDLFDYNTIQIKEQFIICNAIKVNKAVVFCEGHRLINNPYFNWLPLFSLKGECLKFYSIGLPQDQVYKSSYAIVPQGNHRFWCGSNFGLDDLDSACTSKEMTSQWDFVKGHIEADVKLIDHYAGIRPAIRDRRPVLGCHPENSKLVVFGGLGTKGFSIAPYCGLALKEHLISSKPLPKSIQISRFLKKYYQNQPETK